MKRIHCLLPISGLLLLAAAAPVSAGQQQAEEQQVDQEQQQQQQPPPQNSGGGGWRRFSEAAEPGSAPPQTAHAPAAAAMPPGQLTLPAGTWVKVRLDEPLSSDKNRVGDSFTATLSQPLVVNGFVVARRGQTLAGRVSEAVKAGRRSGTSRLGFELIEVGLADGRQMPLRTELLEYSGGTSVGRDVTAVGATTATGAAIGAAAGGGAGAGIGALAGAAAASIGVLATRGRATEVWPESEVTFRTLAPLTIATDAAPQAFQPVRQGDYERTTSLQQRRAVGQPPAVVMGPSVLYGGGWWGGPGWGWGYPMWWGGGWGGGRWYGGGFYRGGGRMGRRW